MITFTNQEFQYLQQWMNEMYQSDNLRSGPSGSMITTIRNKFLIQGPVDLLDAEMRFMLFALNESFNTSQNSFVKSQMGNSMQFLRPDIEPRVKSQINQDPAELTGTFQTQWQVIQSCMTKLGKAELPPYKLLEFGPDGDPFGVSTPMHHDINDGTGYNHR